MSNENVEHLASLDSWLFLEQNMKDYEFDVVYGYYTISFDVDENCVLKTNYARSMLAGYIKGRLTDSLIHSIGFNGNKLYITFTNRVTEQFVNHIFRLCMGTSLEDMRLKIVLKELAKLERKLSTATTEFLSSDANCKKLAKEKLDIHYLAAGRIALDRRKKSQQKELVNDRTN